jgi:hypothetical protein
MTRKFNEPLSWDAFGPKSGLRVKAATLGTVRCPLRVISGHSPVKPRCPLSPRKLLRPSPTGASALGQAYVSSPPGAVSRTPLTSLFQIAPDVDLPSAGE